MLRYRQFLDPETANIRSLINPRTEANIKAGRAKLKKIDQKIKEVLKQDAFKDAPEQYKKKFIDNFMDVLEGKKYNEIDALFQKNFLMYTKKQKT